MRHQTEAEKEHIFTLCGIFVHDGSYHYSQEGARRYENTLGRLLSLIGLVHDVLWVHVFVKAEIIDVLSSELERSSILFIIGIGHTEVFKVRHLVLEVQVNFSANILESLLYQVQISVTTTLLINRFS